MSKKRSLWLKVSAIAVVLVGIIVSTIGFTSKPTYATIDNVILKKALGYGIAECYKQGAMNSPITAASYNSGYGAYSLVGAGGGTYTQPTGAYGGDYAVALSCSELLNGNGVNGTFAGALNGIAPSNADNTSAFSSFMTNMGYDKSSASSGQCAPFTYRAGDSTDTLKLCAETDNGQSNGKITGKISVSGDGGVNITFKITDTTVEPVCSQLGSWASSCTSHSYTQGSTQFDSLMGEILGDLIAHRKNGILGGSWVLDENLTFEPMGDTLATYKINSKTTAANKAANYLTGYSGSNLALTPNEQLALLQDYMLNFYAVERYGGACNIDSSQETVAAAAGYSMIETSMFGSGLQKCWVRPTKNQNSSVAGFDSNGYFTGTPLYYADVVKAFGGSVNNIFEGDKEKCTTAANNARNTASSIIDQFYNGNTTQEQHDKALKTIEDLDKIKNEHGQYWYEDSNGAIVCYPFTNVDGTVSNTPTQSTEIPDTPTTNPDDGGNVTALDGCFGNAGVLGWIVCPVIKFVGETVSGIYDLIVENYLTMGAATVSDAAVQTAWSKFQGYANILFAIMLIAVILAQVTGIGLSNYGIKKVLPKLIITVVLVNVSFILCAASIDVSNIVGASINDFLKGIDVGGLGASDFNLAVFATNTLTSLFSVGTAAGAIAIAGYAITISGGWGMLLLPLLLALLTALIGIIFFFILLGVRQAAIILLLVVAPIAVVCYALPNTKRYFNRWLKMFSSLLLVYPICGLMMGGGNFASRILLTAGSNAGFLYFLVAMLVQVVPFFLIPSVLKSSMAALGSFGAKLSGFGDKVSGFTTRSIKSSRAYQEHQQEALRNSNRTRNTRIATKNGKIIDALQKRVERGETLTSAEQRQLSRAQFRRARALSGNRKIFNEDTLAEVTAQGVDYATLGENDPRRLATYLQFSDRETGDLSRGYSALYQNNGVAGSTVKQQAELDQALKKLEKSPEDLDAQARFKAITRLMSNSDGGRREMEQTINKHVKDLAADGQSENKGFQWAANEALAGPNGKEFKKVAPSLFNTLNRVAEGGASNAYGSIAQHYDASTSAMVDNFDNDGKLSLNADEKLYTEGIDRMSAALLPEIDDRDFQRYITGLQTGKIKGQDRDKLISSAIEALNDPHIKLKPKTANFVHQIANMKYGEHTAAADLTGADSSRIHVQDAAALTAAGGGELDRIAEGFKNGTIEKDHPTDPTKRSSVLNVMEKALEEARTNGGKVNGIELKASDASKMVKILQDNGRTITQDYSPLMRIKHGRASYSSNWRQATTADIISSGIPGLHAGDWIDVSGAPRRLTAKEVREVKAVEDFNVRQRMKESADNNTPTAP